MNEKHCPDLLAGYALGALDEEDRLEAERHIANCPDCQAECGEVSEALHCCLGQALPRRKPSPLLRTQFLARIAVEMSPSRVDMVPILPTPPTPPMITIDQTVPAQGATPSGRGVAATSARYRWLLGGAAIPAFLVVVLAVLFMQTQNQLSDARNHQLAEAIRIPHVTMPMAGVAAAYGMRGELIVPKKGMSGLLIVYGINHVPTGMTYTCWIRQGGRWTASGTLQPDTTGIAMMAFGRDTDLHSANDVGITMEHTPQPAAPSEPMLLSTTL